MNQKKARLIHAFADKFKLYSRGVKRTYLSLPPSKRYRFCQELQRLIDHAATV